MHDKKQTLKKCNKSYLINNSNHSFYKYCRDIKKFDNLSLKSKYSILAEFFNDFGKLTELKTQKEKKKEKTNVYDTVSELYNDLLEIYFDQYYDLSDVKRSKIYPEYDPANLTLD